jgi:hypothetical protein
VLVELLKEKGYPLWKSGVPVEVFGSESENTEETARCFLEEAGITNIHFTAFYGLNSQKYGSLTHKLKNDIYKKMLEVYGPGMKGTDDEKKKAAKELFKNRFYHFPEGETLIEADWRIAHSFVELFRNNLGKELYSVIIPARSECLKL